ncbi:MAG: M48 family metallopeptidase [Gilvibacter sp.]
MPRITDQAFAAATYPKEDNRFTIAMVVGIPIAILGLILTLATFGLLILYIAFIVFFVWFWMSVAKTHMIGNAVHVTNTNFPEIVTIYRRVQADLGYNQEIPIYIVNEGEVNALLAKFFKTKFIVLNSELVKDMIQNPEKQVQLTWVIARFIGALKAKHFRTTLLKLIFESIEKIKMFNVFLLPYERATQYTGDNIGMLVTGDVEQSVAALNKLMIGNDLHKKVAFRGVLDQGVHLDQHNIFSFFARAFSTHPHLVNRYLNLLAFANKAYPEQFNKYVDAFDNQTKHMLFRVLPHY